MKKVLSTIVIMIMLTTGLFAFSGCGDNGNNTKAKNTVEVSYVNGKGTFTVSVPKKEDGTPKYEFTKEKPENSKGRGTFYLKTDKAVLAFASSGLVYNTSTVYKQKYGEQKATFDGYLSWIDDADSHINLAGMEKLEINGRKAIRYYYREGSSNNYKYYGYSYRIACDDVYPGSGIDLLALYSYEGEPQSKELDEETLEIIKSLKVTVNE